ncbi:rod shape-determining protein MreC [uncultured Helcococcus sp.]|uniref:rod shape-determining protein MreC n=1 Tax=uncultured Helcococcus sp. TaxID=1072508 RepID=UPI00288A35BA|nr:rod shape-determining protein MreC [uncultured Helcococcus sp.]
MLYYNKKKSKKNHYIRILSILVLIIISVISPRANAYTSKALNVVIMPFAKLTSFVNKSVNTVIDATFGSKPNRDMVAQLTEKNQALEKQVNELLFLVDQNDYLKQANEFYNNYSAIRANIILVDNKNVFDEITIDKGSMDGVVTGDIIVSPFKDDQDNVVGALIGKVTDVGLVSSKISTILDQKYNLSFVHSKTSETGIINAREYNILSGYMINKTDIETGDSIYTSGLGGRYPRALYIGKVSEVGESNDKLSQIIKVESPVKFSKLYEVYIMKNTNMNIENNEVAE